MDIENSSRGFLTAFFRQSKTLFLVSGIILAAGMIYLAKTKPVYESVGSLVIKFGQDARPGASDNAQAGLPETDANARQEIINSYIKIIFSSDMLRDLVREFGVYRLYPDFQDLEDHVPADEVAINTLLEGDLIVNYDKSHIISVAVRNSDPEIAKEFASRVIEAFIRKRTEIYNTPQTDFLEQQIAEARTKLDASQQNLQAFKKEAGISAIDEELAQLLREKSELHTVAYTAITEAQAKLSELETQEAEMRATYRPESPFLQRLSQTVAVARENLQSLRAALNGSASTGSSLAIRMADVDERLAYLESKRGRFNELQQQLKIDEENYLFYLKRGEEARINKLMNSQNITRIGVLDHPVAPVLPIKPRRTLVLSITLLAAIMAGAGVALSRELLDDRLTNPDQVYSSLGVPVLATFEKEIVR